MPTYELRCRDCGHVFERFLMRLLKDEDKVCPVCGSSQVVTGVGGGYLAPVASSKGGCAPRGGFA
jgi:putative FmdB family regulatory protein